MLKGVPSPEELEQAATNYFYLSITDCLSSIDGEQHFLRSASGLEANVELEEEYWRHQERHLGMCASLLFTGAELLLKSHVARISPFLLLCERQKWNKATFFDELRTRNASELPDLLDSIREEKLSPSFRDRFKSARVRRNAIVHAASGRVVPTATELITDALAFANELVGPASWLTVHREIARSHPGQDFDWHGSIECTLHEDVASLFRLLSDGQSQKFLGARTSSIVFRCPEACKEDFPPDSHTAMLIEASNGNPRTLHCLACDDKKEVSNDSCPGCNTHALVEGKCMRCED